MFRSPSRRPLRSCVRSGLRNQVCIIEGALWRSYFLFSGPSYLYSYSTYRHFLHNPPPLCTKGHAKQSPPPGNTSAPTRDKVFTSRVLYYIPPNPPSLILALPFFAFASAFPGTISFRKVFPTAISCLAAFVRGADAGRPVDDCPCICI